MYSLADEENRGLDLDSVFGLGDADERLQLYNTVVRQENTTTAYNVSAVQVRVVGYTITILLPCCHHTITTLLSYYYHNTIVLTIPYLIIIL